jgi:thymidine kinase
MIIFITGIPKSGKSSSLWRKYTELCANFSPNPDFYPDVILHPNTVRKDSKLFDVIGEISRYKLHIAENLTGKDIECKDIAILGNIVFIDDAEKFDNPVKSIQTILGWDNANRVIVIAGLRKDEHNLRFNLFTDWLLQNATDILVMDSPECESFRCREKGYNYIQDPESGKRTVLCKTHYFRKLFETDKIDDSYKVASSEVIKDSQFR